MLRNGKRAAGYPDKLHRRFSDPAPICRSSFRHDYDDRSTAALGGDTKSYSQHDEGLTHADFVRKGHPRLL